MQFDDLNEAPNAVPQAQGIGGSNLNAPSLNVELVAVPAGAQVPIHREADVGTGRHEHPFRGERKLIEDGN